MLRAHHDVSTAVCLAQRNRYLRHSSLTVSIEQLGSVRNHTIVLLACTRQESRHIHQSNQRNIESIAEADETSCLTRCIGVETAGHHLWLVGYDTYALAIEASKTNDDIPGIITMYFEEFAMVYDRSDHFVHIVRTVSLVGDNFVQ